MREVFCVPKFEGNMEIDDMPSMDLLELSPEARREDRIDPV